MTTIGNRLKWEIERYAQDLAQSGQLVLATKNGRLTVEHIGAYVSGLRFLIRGTLRVIRRAEERAAAEGEGALAAHYGQKLHEEQGHERWAEQDLENLASTAEYGRDASATALGRLLAYLEDVTNRDPCLFLSYMLLAEYLTVLAAPNWLGILESNCGIPRSSLTVVTKHVALDSEHVVEGIEAIDRLVASPDKLDPMLDVLRKSVSHFEEFWTEVLSAAPMAA